MNEKYVDISKKRKIIVVILLHSTPKQGLGQWVSKTVFLVPNCVYYRVQNRHRHGINAATGTFKEK